MCNLREFVVIAVILTPGTCGREGLGRTSLRRSGGLGGVSQTSVSSTRNATFAEKVASRLSETLLFDSGRPWESLWEGLEELWESFGRLRGSSGRLWRSSGRPWESSGRV